MVPICLMKGITNLIIHSNPGQPPSAKWSKIWNKYYQSAIGVNTLEIKCKEKLKAHHNVIRDYYKTVDTEQSDAAVDLVMLTA